MAAHSWPGPVNQLLATNSLIRRPINNHPISIGRICYPRNDSPLGTYEQYSIDILGGSATTFTE